MAGVLSWPAAGSGCGCVTSERQWYSAVYPRILLPAPAAPHALHPAAQRCACFAWPLRPPLCPASLPVPTVPTLAQVVWPAGFSVEKVALNETVEMVPFLVGSACYAMSECQAAGCLAGWMRKGADGWVDGGAEKAEQGIG